MKNGAEHIMMLSPVFISGCSNPILTQEIRNPNLVFLLPV